MGFLPALHERRATSAEEGKTRRGPDGTSGPHRRSEPKAPTNNGTTVSRANAGNVHNTSGNNNLTGTRRGLLGSPPASVIPRLDRQPLQRRNERSAVSLRRGQDLDERFGRTHQVSPALERVRRAITVATLLATARNSRPTGPPARTATNSTDLRTGCPAPATSTNRSIVSGTDDRMLSSRLRRCRWSAAVADRTDRAATATATRGDTSRATQVPIATQPV